MEMSIIYDLVDNLHNQVNLSLPTQSSNRIVPNVYFVGPECVGKSTLFNTLLGVNKAHVSDIPLDVNIVVNEIWADALKFIDGITYTGNYKDFSSSIRNADLFIQVCDIRSIRRLDYDITQILKTSNIPYLIVLNKVDTIETNYKRQIIKENFESKLEEKVLLLSAQTGENVNEMVYLISQLIKRGEQVEFLETIAKQGKKLKRTNTDHMRRQKCGEVIQKYIREIVKVSSLKASNLVEVVFLQSEMIKQIGKIYNIETPPEVVERRIKHIISAAIHVLASSVPLIQDKLAVTSIVIWTTSIGNTAIELFESEISEEHITRTIKYYSGQK